MNENVKLCISRKKGKCELLPGYPGWGCKLVAVPISAAHSQQELLELVTECAIRTGAIECPHFNLSHCECIIKTIYIAD